MLTAENFSEEHIRALQKSSKCDPSIIERTLYAFGLLEALTRVEMPFIFKGGTSLMLLLSHPRRLSTDVDILVKPGTDVNGYIEAASKLFPFKKCDEQRRVGHNKIEKRHFKFIYQSPVTGKDFYILLDVVFEKNPYPSLIRRDIKNDLLLGEGEFKQAMLPNINSVLGDKLTAFAPHTTGILLNVGKNTEVIKQFYDVATLLEEFTDFDEVARSYASVVQTEIDFREGNMTADMVLRDTFEAAACIASRGKIKPEEYPVYIKGIRDLHDHIYAEAYTPEVAAVQAPIILYAVACLLRGQNFERVTDAESYLGERYINNALKPLKFLRRVEPIAYAYSIKADRLINNL